MRNILIIGLFGLMAIGCATVPKPEVMKKEIAGFELPAKPSDGKAMVYVVRPSPLATLIRFNVFLDSKEASHEMGWTRGSQHIYFELEPGHHRIFSKAENWSEAQIRVKAGDIAFLRQDATMGFLIARGGMTSINDVEGRYHVKKTKLGTILQKKKVATK